MDPQGLAVWNDPGFLRAVMYLGLITAIAIVVVGFPSLFRKGETASWAFLLIVLAFLGTAGAIGGYLEYSGEDASGFSSFRERRMASSGGSIGIDRVLNIPSVIPNLEAVLTELPGFLSGMNGALKEISPLLERTNSLMGQMEPLLGEVRDALKKVDKAEAAVDQLLPVLQQTSVALGDVTPMLADLRLMLADVRSGFQGRDTAKTIQQLLGTLDLLQHTLDQADEMLVDLAFLDENWVRHFLQVEGIRAHAGFGKPEIPAGSQPHVPPPLKK